MDQNGVPEAAMVIIAHPDDAEFTFAGTVAAWTRTGCPVTYVLCTSGNIGSHEPGMTREKLTEIRREEQRAACQLLGVTEVVFLGHDDGTLMPTLELRKELVQVIRRYKPEVVLCSDPTRVLSGNGYINHPDHRAAGITALDACAPACEMELLWPELGPAHKVRQVYVSGNEQCNLWVDITETIDIKIAALKKHVSQMGDWDPSEMIKKWNSDAGKEQGMAYAERYRVMTL